MCGITAYVGDGNCANILINSLKTLSNRGYDSAGFVLSNTGTDDIVFKKKATKDGTLAIEELEKSAACISDSYNKVSDILGGRLMVS
jgi:glucosamine 6-phosphate synthetase-like amidotransferase/phosphosugar isomerase protein